VYSPDCLTTGIDFKDFLIVRCIENGKKAGCRLPSQTLELFWAFALSARLNTRINGAKCDLSYCIVNGLSQCSKLRPANVSHWRALSQDVIGLGCAHAQPKEKCGRSFGACWKATSAVRWVREGYREPVRQIAAREMEIVRIQGALPRVKEA
jgi:hypothetical protein